MSVPAMAASMEAEIRARFWVALGLTALVVLISPMGEMLGIGLPLSAAVRSRTLLVLTTPIVFWCGWIFVAGGVSSHPLLRPLMFGVLPGGALGASGARVYTPLACALKVVYST